MCTFFNANLIVIVLFRWERLRDDFKREHAIYIQKDLTEILQI